MKNIKIYRRLYEIGFSELAQIYWNNGANYTLRCALANVRMGNITYADFKEVLQTAAE